jgi:hypothetical protein
MIDFFWGITFSEKASRMFRVAMSSTGTKPFCNTLLDFPSHCVSNISDEDACILYLSGEISKSQNRGM